MATKPKTDLYVVMYKDLTNVNYELSAAEFKIFTEAIASGDKAVVLKDIGVLVLEDVRAVIKQKPIEEDPAPTPAADPSLTPEEMAWVLQYRDMVQTGKDGYN